MGMTAFLAVVLGAANVQGQLSTDEQRCLDAYNNKLRLVSAAQNKDNRKCIKNATKGKEPGANDPDYCVTADAPGKVAKKTAKLVQATFDPSTGKCDAVVGNAVPLSGPIYFDPYIGNDAHVGGAVDLAHGIFGDPILAETFDPADKDKGKCQDKVYQRAHQIFDTKMKEFRKCERTGMKARSITNNATLEVECMSDGSTHGIPDPKGKIAKKIGQLGADITKKCQSTASGTVDIPGAIPGLCAGEASWADVTGCLEALVECRVCETLNAADNTSRDCDLFDNGVADDSCLPVLPASCSDGVQNGDETDVDCGGGTCAGCAAGGACSRNNDCESGICPDGTCAASVCGDGVTNGSDECDEGPSGAFVGGACWNCTSSCTCTGTACVSGDGQCPAECGIEVDSDCSAGDSCFVDNGTTVLDTCRNLEWEKKSVLPPPLNVLNDVDTGFTWAGKCTVGDAPCQPNQDAADLCKDQTPDSIQPIPPAGCGTCTVSESPCNIDPYGVGAYTTVWDDLAQILNAGVLGGGWRIAKDTELETIADCGFGLPCIDPIFGATASSGYWASRYFAANDSYYVSFGNGYVYAGSWTSNQHVRVVRSGP